MADQVSSCNRREFIKWTAAAGLSGLLPGCGLLSRPDKRLNILFVIVDDLRPELGCYGNPEIHTPHFDRFAKESVLFSRTHCQAAACAPSRASVFLGQRPDTTRVWNLSEKFRQIHPNAVTMPQHFDRFGYHTVSMGKMFHNHMPDPVSFNEPDLRPPVYATPGMIDRDPESFYYDEELNAELAEVRLRRLAKNPNAYGDGWPYGRSWESSDAPDNAFYDGAQTDLAVKKLKELKNRKDPFFFGLGYFRPHLPFVAPKKYWDLYDRDRLSPAPNPFLPENAPTFAMNTAYELTACYDLEWVKHPAVEPLPEETARLLKHGYYASVSYVDACFGRLMDGLKETGLDRNTIVVVWGDHGWKLGEHGSWCKQTNYNIDTRVPLMIRVPGMDSAGETCDSLTELVDLYPTLCDLTGVKAPDGMEGVSLKPLLADPGRKIKSAAFSQYNQRPKNTLDGGRYMGYSMVTEQYHYVEWYTWDDDKKQSGDKVGVELYDNGSDPQENVSIAGLSENAGLVQDLSTKLKAGWKSPLINK
ncbi:MAG: sulfatase-like hydrolase/transferase [Candidatus Aminicenantes bacterium]|nr:sulfatase-like hydrolase/transferase [Candidatus Aminicenantes bacterium]